MQAAGAGHMPEADEEASGRPAALLRPARIALALAYVAAAAAYLAWRATILDLSHPFFSLAFFAAEATGVLGLLLHVWVVRRLARRPPERAPEGLTVDVFVSAADEPVDTVRRTLLAVCAMDHPHGTWLLDDGARPDLEALAQSLGVRYLARTAPEDGRAGGLNRALACSDARLVAVFDAHHAPARSFLTETLGHFRDPRLAFVQTPPDAYNLDSFAHRRARRGRIVWHDQTLVARVVQRSRDADNAAMFTGTGAVLRRTALDAVGGFAAGTRAEDLHTSLRLHAAGWRSAYHARPLAFGMAPASVGRYLDRYLRQGIGAVQVWKSERLLVSRRLTWTQKLAYLDAVLAHFAGWRKAVYYLAPVVILTTGALPFSVPVAEFAPAFLAFHVLGIWLRTETGRGYADVLREEQFQMTRFGASIAATLAPLAGATLHGVSRDPGRRAAFAAGSFVLPQIALLFASALAIPAGVVLHFRAGVLPHDALVASVLWAVVNGALAASVLWTSARLATFRRRDYRFPVPVPVRLADADDGARLGICDDVSVSGFRFYGPLPARLAVGARLHGELVLPDGATPFTARVREQIAGAGGRHVKGVGCSFEWRGPAERRALERYLFGTDLQWAVSGISERTPTPLEQLTRLAWRLPSGEPAAHWAPALYANAANTLVPPGVGCVAVSRDAKAPQRLATLVPLDTRRPVRLRVVTRTGSVGVTRQPIEDGHIDTAASPVFLYRLA